MKSMVTAAATALFVASTLPVGATAPEMPMVDQALPLTPFAAELQNIVFEADSTGSEVGTYYGQRGFLPVWFADDTRAVAFLTALARADEHGLPEARYNLEALTEAVNAAVDDRTRAEAELALTRTYLRFARDLNSGILEPRKVDRELQHRPEVKSVDWLMDVVLNSADLDDAIAALAPADPQYLALLAEKARLQEVMREGNFGARISTSRLIRPGYVGDRVAQVRQRLTAMGYEDAAPIVDIAATDADIADAARVYDDALEEVVKRFQGDQQLNKDGILGPATIGALNASPEDRLEQILVNLERHRWLNVDKGNRHIRVNIADFSVAVYDAGEITFWSRVVVGKNTYDRRTPEFADTMTHLIVNPYWHVPKSIARKEYLPLLQQDPQALARRGLLLMNSRGQVLNTAGADFSGYSQSNFPFYVKQPPGPRNALGRVKFMFPNKNNIYLHDTPAKNLFERERRAYSHGCIRVHRPFELAYHLLAAQNANPKGQFHSLLDTGRERQVNFDQPVNIYLSYHTAFMAEDGAIIYRSDVYGRDKKVMAALRDAGVETISADG